MLLAKLISSGLASLGISGLGLYFVPKYSDLSSENVDLIYETSESTEKDKFKKEREHRSKLLQTLEELQKKFSVATSELKNQKDSKHKSITETFEKISSEEDSLKAEYERGKKWLDQIGRIIKGIYGASQKKLQLDAIIEEIDYLNEALAKMYGAISTWGFSLEQFICAIDNQNQNKKCDKEELKNWLSKSANGASISPQQPSSGGGTSASQEALKQLADSKKNLQERQEKIKRLLIHLRDKNISKLLEGSLLKASRDFLKQEIEFHNQFLKTWNDQGLSDSMQKIQSQTEQLNSSYKILEDTYHKWETVKGNLSSIYHYQSLITNFICKNQWDSQNLSNHCLSNLDLEN